MVMVCVRSFRVSERSVDTWLVVVFGGGSLRRQRWSMSGTASERGGCLVPGGGPGSRFIKQAEVRWPLVWSIDGGEKVQA